MNSTLEIANNLGLAQYIKKEGEAVKREDFDNLESPCRIFSFQSNKAYEERMGASECERFVHVVFALGFHNEGDAREFLINFIRQVCGAGYVLMLRQAPMVKRDEVGYTASIRCSILTIEQAGGWYIEGNINDFLQDGLLKIDQSPD